MTPKQFKEHIKALDTISVKLSIIMIFIAMLVGIAFGSILAQ
jgi:hypothetical protein